MTKPRTATASEKQLIAKAAAAQPETASPAPVPANDRGSNSRPIEDFPDLEDVLPELALRSRDLTTRIKEMEFEKKKIHEEIDLLLKAAGHNSIAGDTWETVRALGSSTSISKTKLLAHGVTMKVIDDCMEKKEYYYVQVRERKVRGE